MMQVDVRAELYLSASRRGMRPPPAPYQRETPPLYVRTRARTASDALKHVHTGRGARPSWTVEEARVWVARWRAGESYASIARDVPLSVEQVARICKRLAVLAPEARDE
jgi:hypothetical protein